MKYITFLMLFILMYASPALQAQDVRYRVELLVMLHLNHGETPERADWLADYTAAVDLLAPEEEPPEPCPDPALDTGGDSVEDIAPASAATEEPAEQPPDPNALFRVEEMGPEMQDAWRRLRLSAGFRPLQYQPHSLDLSASRRLLVV